MKVTTVKRTKNTNILTGNVKSNTLPFKNDVINFTGSTEEKKSNFFKWIAVFGSTALATIFAIKFHKKLAVHLAKERSSKEKLKEFFAVKLSPEEVAKLKKLVDIRFSNIISSLRSNKIKIVEELESELIKAGKDPSENLNIGLRKSLESADHNILTRQLIASHCIIRHDFDLAALALEKIIIENSSAGHIPSGRVNELLSVYKQMKVNPQRAERFLEKFTAKFPLFDKEKNRLSESATINKEFRVVLDLPELKL